MSERFKLHQPAPVFHRKGTLGELVTNSRKDPKCVDGCGHARSQHVISEATFTGYCAAGNCACTKFDNFAIEYGERRGESGIGMIQKELLRLLERSYCFHRRDAEDSDE